MINKSTFLNWFKVASSGMAYNQKMKVIKKLPEWIEELRQSEESGSHTYTCPYCKTEFILSTEPELLECHRWETIDYKTGELGDNIYLGTFIRCINPYCKREIMIDHELVTSQKISYSEYIKNVESGNYKEI